MSPSLVHDLVRFRCHGLPLCIFCANTGHKARVPRQAIANEPFAGLPPVDRDSSTHAQKAAYRLRDGMPSPSDRAILQESLVVDAGRNMRSCEWPHHRIGQVLRDGPPQSERSTTGRSKHGTAAQRRTSREQLRSPRVRRRVEITTPAWYSARSQAGSARSRAGAMTHGRRRVTRG